MNKSVCKYISFCERTRVAKSMSPYVHIFTIVWALFPTKIVDYCLLCLPVESLVSLVPDRVLD